MNKLKEKEIKEKLIPLKGWEYTSDSVIEKILKFDNFKEAFSVMNRIAFECEAQNHHPNWSNVYNTVNIKLNTHEVNGITDKDFKLAQSIEKILGSM